MQRFVSRTSTPVSEGAPASAPIPIRQQAAIRAYEKAGFDVRAVRSNALVTRLRWTMAGLRPSTSGRKPPPQSCLPLRPCYLPNGGVQQSAFGRPAYLNCGFCLSLDRRLESTIPYQPFRLYAYPAAYSNRRLCLGCSAPAFTTLFSSSPPRRRIVVRRSRGAGRRRKGAIGGTAPFSLHPCRFVPELGGFGTLHDLLRADRPLAHLIASTPFGSSRS